VLACLLTLTFWSNNFLFFSFLIDQAILQGFADKGIPASDIIPRENVFTYNAWLALNRQVRKGEHGVKVVTWIPAKNKDSESSYMLCRRSTVFHVSQTDPIQ